MIEIRCVKCRRRLLDAEIVKGVCRCPKCGYDNKLDFNSNESILEHDLRICKENGWPIITKLRTY